VDRNGGTAVITRAVGLFYDRMLADPSLAGWFEGVDMTALRTHQRAFLIAALGGPDAYGGRDLRSAHAGLGIDDTAYDAALVHLVAALAEAGVDAVAAAGMRSRLEGLRHQIVAA
jgi:hemoglobin